MKRIIIDIVLFIIAVLFVASCNINWAQFGFKNVNNTKTIYHIIECDEGVCNHSEF